MSRKYDKAVSSRKSAKDRLGSKLSEDEVVLRNPIESSSSSAVRENISVDRRLPAYAYGSRYQNRSRSRSLSVHNPKFRNRSWYSSERQEKRAMESSRRQSPGTKSSPSSRSRRRSGSREQRRYMSKEKRSTSETSRDEGRRRTPTPLPSRERKQRDQRTRRSPSPSREMRTQGSRSRGGERERNRSNSRAWGRSREREPRRRSNSRPRRPQSPEKRWSPRRDRTSRRRSFSRERDHFGGIQRSPFKRPCEASRQERKEPIPHSSSRRSSDSTKQVDAPPTPETRVFPVRGCSSRSGQGSSPTLKKQKRRFNIKLSSISKTDQYQSGSSSSDDDEDYGYHRSRLS